MKFDERQNAVKFCAYVLFWAYLSETLNSRPCVFLSAAWFVVRKCAFLFNATSWWNHILL